MSSVKSRKQKKCTPQLVLDHSETTEILFAQTLPKKLPDNLHSSFKRPVDPYVPQALIA